MALPEAPNSRSEQYLAKIAGQETELPEAPNSRVEQYLEYIAENGTVSEEKIAEKVSTWLEENIHEDPTVVIDASLSVSGAAADAKAAGDEISDLKADFNALGVAEVSSYGHIYGNMSNGNTWNNTTNPSYQFIAIPIKPNDEIITSFENTIPIGFLKTFVSAVEGTTIDFSEQEGFSTKILTGLSLKRFIVPQDAHYLIIENIHNNVTYAINTLVINGYNLKNTIPQNLNEIKNDLNQYIDNMYVLTPDAYPLQLGHLSNQKTWSNLNTNYQHIVIPVSPGDVVRLSMSNNAPIAFLTEYNVATEGGAILYSTEIGYDNKITVGSIEQWFTVPNDTHYLVIEKVVGGNTYDINMLIINGYDYTNNLSSTIVNIVNTKHISIEWEIGAINSSTGQDASSSFRVRTVWFYDIKNGVKVNVPDGMKVRICQYGADNTFIASSDFQESSFVFCPIAVDATKFRAFGGYSDNRTIDSGNAFYGNQFTFEYLDISDDASVCYGIGDSNMQGFYSYSDGSADHIMLTNNCWFNIAMSSKRHRFYNLGVGGSGFVHNGTVLDCKNAKEHVDSIDFSKADYVIMAYGVNDWKYNEPLGDMNSVSGDGTIYGNMKYVVEKIISDNPLCKIFVVTPLNSCNTTKNYGDESTNWGLGYRLSNSGTLEDVFQAEKDISEYYGLQLIDQTHGSIVNRKNILSALIDGVHPSYDCHVALGKEMAEKITF